MRERVKKYKTSLFRIAFFSVEEKKKRERYNICQTILGTKELLLWWVFPLLSWKVQTNILYISPRKYVLFECTHKPARPGSVRGAEAPWSRIHERTISLRFLGIILRVLRLEVSYTMFTFQTIFKPLLLMGGGVGGGSKIHQ